MFTPAIERVNVFNWSDPYVKPDEHVEEDLSKKAHVISPALNVQVWTYLGGDRGNVTMQDVVDFARQYGIELEALCHYRWVPTQIVTNHDVCRACMAIAQSWISEDEG